MFYVQLYTHALDTIAHTQTDLRIYTTYLRSFMHTLFTNGQCCPRQHAAALRQP